MFKQIETMWEDRLKKTDAPKHRIEGDPFSHRSLQSSSYRTGLTEKIKEARTQRMPAGI